MNEELDEERDDYLAENKELKEDFEIEFEPIDETCQNEIKLGVVFQLFLSLSSLKKDALRKCKSLFQPLLNKDLRTACFAYNIIFV